MEEKKEFKADIVSFETALKLKEIGFDELTDEHYAVADCYDCADDPTYFKRGDLVPAGHMGIPAADLIYAPTLFGAKKWLIDELDVFPEIYWASTEEHGTGFYFRISKLPSQHCGAAKLLIDTGSEDGSGCYIGYVRAFDAAVSKAVDICLNDLDRK